MIFKKLRWSYIIPFILCLLLFIYLKDKYLCDPNFSGQIILFFTFVAIIWYSIETRGMKLELQKQNEFANRPIIIIYEDKDSTFYIQNIGNAPALNIRIEDIILSSEFNVQLKFYPPNILRKDEGSILKIKKYIKGEETDFNFEANIQSPYAKENYETAITFSNTDGVTYQSKISFGKNGPKVMSIKAGKGKGSI